MDYLQENYSRIAVKEGVFNQKGVYTLLLTYNKGFPFDEKGQITVKMTENTSKKAYNLILHNSEILVLSRAARMEMNAEEFYKNLKILLPTADYEFNTDRQICINIEIKPHPSIDTRKFELKLVDMNVPDVTRMTEMMTDLLVANQEFTSTKKKLVESLNVALKKQLTHTFHASKDFPYFFSGISQPEDNHRWSSGDELIIRMPIILENLRVSKLILRDVRALVDKNTIPRFIVCVQGFSKILNAMHRDFREPHHFTIHKNNHTIEIPISEDFHADFDVSIILNLPTACSPKSLSLNDDTRILAISLSSIDIEYKINI